MAVTNFYNAHFTINSVNLSDHVESVKLDFKKDMLESTAMSNTEHRYVAGLTDWSLEVTFYQDYAVASVDATLWTLTSAGAVTFALRPDAGAKSTSNPEYGGSVYLESYEPISGGVGTLQKVSAKFRAASVLTRSTS